MNTLTQQQINQYQWQAADGVAKAINPISYNPYNNIWIDFEANIPIGEYFTNAPDGIYSGEAFELVPQTCSPWREDWRDSRYWEDEDFESLTYEQWADYIEGKYEGNVTTRLFLCLKPSHLPAVLTTQPGEEWKDRYREVWLVISERPESRTYKSAAQPDTAELNYEQWVNYMSSIKVKREWRLITPPGEQEDWYCPKCKAYLCGEQVTFEETHQTCGTEVTIGKPAEQEAETVEEAADLAFFIDEEWAQIDKYVQYSKRHGFMRGAAWQLEQLQSTLTQKDQRIAELEQMVDQCQKNDLYFEQEKEQLNKRIAELERETEWISVDERKPDNISTVLIWTNISINPTLGYYVSDDWLYFSHNDNFWLKTEKHIKVVKWMPLPTPPQH